MDFTQYVHEYWSERTDSTRYAVAEWNPERAQFFAPLDSTTAKLTGCSGKFCRKLPGGMDTYPTRTQALRRARYLFGPEIA